MMLCYVKFKAGLGRFGYSYLGIRNISECERNLSKLEAGLGRFGYNYLGIHNVSECERNLRMIDFLPSNDILG